MPLLPGARPASSRVALALAALLASTGLPAADPPGAYTFRSYGPEQGLRNLAVTCLGQDAEGFLYAGTEDGLYRYDGTRFRRFGVADGLPSDSVTLLHLGRDGRFRVGTRMGIVVWSGTRAEAPLPGPFLPEEDIDGITATRGGHLVVSTAHGAFEGDGGRVAPLAGIDPGKPAPAWISEDGAELLVASGGRLHRRDAQGRWTRRDLPGEAVQTVIKDGQGRIWLRGRRQLLRLASFEAPVEDLGRALPGAAVQKGTLTLDRRGRMWAPTNLGLVCFEGGRSQVLTDARGLPGQWVTAVLVDREDNLWTASEGVHRLLGRLAWTAHTRRQGLPSDTVWGLFRSRDGLLWAGTNRGLVQAGTRAWVPVPGTSDRSFYTFAEGVDGSLWVGGTNAPKAPNALLLRSPGAAGFRAVPLGIQGASIVNSLAFGPDGALYIGTMAHGLWRLRRQDGASHAEPVAVPGGDAAEQVNQLVRDGRGTLWMAGMKGLASFDGRTWRRFSLAEGLRELQVEALAPTPSGELWVSYWNQRGLTRFEPGGQAVQVSVPEDLFQDNIYSMGLDARGALWLGTAQGLRRWKDGKVERFGRGEGLPGEDAAANAFWADASGDVWAGMASGLAHFQADQDPGIPAAPATRITQVLDGAGRSLAQAPARVPWRNRALTFHFSSLSYVNEAQVQCQVRLAGFEDAWRSVDIREARYTGLPPGRYRFEARSRVGTGDFGPPASFQVAILAPWWRQAWFMALEALGAAGLLFLYIRWRLGLLSRRNLHLEALVQARTRDLEQAMLALQEASMVDPLTGLKNRRYLGLSMPTELARVTRQRRGLQSADRAREGQNVDLLFFMVDLDHFKAVNDTHGHAAGDQVLRQASEAIRSACRKMDIVVRWGGEEFLIVARNTDRAHAPILARSIWSAVREHPFELSLGVVLHKTCSIGFSAFPLLEDAPEAHSWEEAVELADQCLYAAKRSGRDGWVGVTLPAGAGLQAPGLLRNLGALAAEGRIQVSTSFPEDAPVQWP